MKTYKATVKTSIRVYVEMQPIDRIDIVYESFLLQKWGRQYRMKAENIDIIKEALAALQIKNDDMSMEVMRSSKGKIFWRFNAHFPTAEQAREFCNTFRKNKISRLMDEL